MTLALVAVAVVNLAALAGAGRDPAPGWELRDTTQVVDTRHMIERGGR